ncbi:hypothetical protein L1281_002045 [Neisseria sp. HSC-16F19]|nr:hypothetical protein [Neisseria sp. HSC-16F19]MCP2041445.1 hypothetical protein [Neisseria sp. HSC-16F19]
MKLNEAVHTLSELMRGQGGRTLEALAEESGIKGKLLTDALYRMEELGMIGTQLRQGHTLYRWEVGGTVPLAEDQPQPEEMVAVPVLSLQANADEKPYWAEDINIGGFADGTFVIVKAGGRNELKLSRKQMLAVVAFVNRFVAMEAAS